MRLSTAIDRFCRDMTAEGRMNSPATERDYRYCLDRHGLDVELVHEPARASLVGYIAPVFSIFYGVVLLVVLPLPGR